jgi:hypothetical protein
MGKTQKVDGAVASTPRLLDNIEKGINHYTEQPNKHTIHLNDNVPQKPFGFTFNTRSNLLQQALTTQSHIGWDNFLKGRIIRDGLTYVRHNERHSNGNGKSKDCSATFVGGRWEHL